MLRFQLIFLSFLSFAVPNANAQQLTAPVEGFIDLHSHLSTEVALGSFMFGSVMGKEDDVLGGDGGNPLGVTTTHAGSRILLAGEGIGNDTGVHHGRRFGFAGTNTDKRIAKNYSGWPSSHSAGHQQMWIGWLKDAHLRGLKIMVASLLESQMMCSLTPMHYHDGLWNAATSTADHKEHYHHPNCDEMKSVFRQLDLVQAIVAQNSEWIEIAISANEARRIIAQGKLALVLSVEVTDLFGINPFLPDQENPTDVEVLEAFQKLYEGGVRSFQLAHHGDSAFSGAAPVGIGGPTAPTHGLAKSLYVLGYLDGPGLGPSTVLAANGFIADHVGPLEALFNNSTNPIVRTECHDPQGNWKLCDGARNLNRRGLTQRGSAFLHNMFEVGMLPDIAHMSRTASLDAVSVFQNAGNYPIFQSHGDLFESTIKLTTPSKKAPKEKKLADGSYARNEKFLTSTQLEQIKQSRGMLGLRTGPVRATDYAETQVLNSCDGSSRSFAQNWARLYDKGVGAGIAPDLNAMVPQMVGRSVDRDMERFGSETKTPCHGQGSQLQSQINDPIVSQNWTTAFPKNEDLSQLPAHPDNISDARNHYATWFSEKGLAHIGLLPELVRDLAHVGLEHNYLHALNSSAETFLQMWDRADRQASTGEKVKDQENLAFLAALSSSDTYCAVAKSASCYDLARVTDGNRTTLFRGYNGWRADVDDEFNPNKTPLNKRPFVQLSWSSPKRINKIKLFTATGADPEFISPANSGYAAAHSAPASKYKLQYKGPNTAGAWSDILEHNQIGTNDITSPSSVSEFIGHADPIRTHRFPSILADAIRWLPETYGDNAFPGKYTYVLNEIEVYDTRIHECPDSDPLCGDHDIASAQIELTASVQKSSGAEAFLVTFGWGQSGIPKPNSSESYMISVPGTDCFAVLPPSQTSYRLRLTQDELWSHPIRVAIADGIGANGLSLTDAKICHSRLHHASDYTSACDASLSAVSACGGRLGLSHQSVSGQMTTCLTSEDGYVLNMGATGMFSFPANLDHTICDFGARILMSGTLAEGGLVTLRRPETNAFLGVQANGELALALPPAPVALRRQFKIERVVSSALSPITYNDRIRLKSLTTHKYLSRGNDGRLLVSGVTSAQGEAFTLTPPRAAPNTHEVCLRSIASDEPRTFAISSNGFSLMDLADSCENDHVLIEDINGYWLRSGDLVRLRSRYGNKHIAQNSLSLGGTPFAIFQIVTAEPTISKGIGFGSSVTFKQLFGSPFAQRNYLSLSSNGLNLSNIRHSFRVDLN